jgi:hypothetical protein
MDSSSPRRPDRSEHPPTLVLHSSWTGLAAAVVTPALLLVFALWMLGARGPQPLPLALLTVAVATAGAALAGFPRQSRLDAEGITLTRLGRRRHLAWSEVRAITRGPGTQAARSRALREPGPGAGRDPAGRPLGGTSPRGHATTDEELPVSGGLIAVGVGRRRWLLTDQVESRAQFDALTALTRHLDPPVPVRAKRPHAAAPPTDLYRRRRGD